MPRYLFLVLAVIVACSNGSGPSVTPTATSAPESSPTAGEVTDDPSSRLVEFLDALRDGDFAATAQLVDEPQILLLTAVEVADVALVEGVAGGTAQLDAQVRDNFWTSFSEAIPGLADPNAVLALSVPRSHTVDSDEFVAIDVTLADGGPIGVWVLRDTGDEAWLIDPIGSFGGPFVGPYAQWAESLTGDERRTALEAAQRYRTSWQVLGDRQPLDEPGIATNFALDELFEVLDQLP